MQSNELWQLIAEALSNGIEVCLVTMVDAEGDGPNRPGARMAVLADGTRCGTVGGGLSERALSNAATEILDGTERPAPALMTMKHSDSGDDGSSGMICSGTQVFAVAYLTARDAETCRRIARSPGTLSLSAEGLRFRPEISGKQPITFDPAGWLYEEAIGVRDTVTLIGGGHVSLALSPLLTSLGMRVMVLDNRDGLSTMQENEAADRLLVVDYTDIARHVPTGDRSYACVMTFGHKHDEEVLAQLAEQPLRYLGMMGSQSKIAEIRDRLLARGISEKALDAVHMPIGLPIGSNTPQEIAISIAAEIIAVRNRPQHLHRLRSSAQESRPIQPAAEQRLNRNQ